MLAAVATRAEYCLLMDSAVLGIAATIAPVFLVIFLGFALQRLGIADDRWTEILNKYGLYVGFPALILHSLLQVSSTGGFSFALLGFSALVLVAVLVLTWLLCTQFRIVGILRNTYTISVFFGNVAYVGFPIVTSLLPGSDAAVSAHAAVYLAVLFTIGVAVLEYARGYRRSVASIVVATLKNPLLLAVAAGAMGIALGVQLPTILAKPLAMLSATASPVVLIALGVFIARHSLSSVTRRHAFAISAIKLVVLPLVFWIACTAAFPHEDCRVPILEAAMPVGFTPFALAELYPLDREVISSAIVITTLLSAGTLFVVAALLGV